MAKWWSRGSEKFAWHRGLRNAVAIALPLVIGVAIGSPAAGALFGLGAYLVSFADDKGGSYRPRAEAVLICAAANALCYLIGSVTAGTWFFVVIFAVLSFAAGFTSILGPATSATGGMAMTAMLVAMAGGPAGHVGSALLMLGGGLWMCILAVGLWPVRPLAPAIEVTAKLCDQLAALAPRLGQTIGERERLPIETAASKARKEVSESTANASGNSAAGVRLLELIDRAERVSRRLMAADRELLAWLDGVEAPAEFASLRTEIAATWKSVADCLDGSIAEVDLSALRTANAEWSAYVAAERARTREVTGVDYSHYLLLFSLNQTMPQLVADTEGGGEVATAIATREFGTEAGTDSRLIRESRYRSWGRLLRANFNWQSAGFRHAVRLCLLTTGTLAVLLLAGVPYAEWAVITIVRILKPSIPVTKTRAAQRIAGNVLGGVLAALALVYSPSLYFSAALIFVLMLIGISARPVNYGYYVIFATPCVLLLTEFDGSGELREAFYRAGETILGGVIALIGAFALWPMWEKAKLPATVAKSVDTCRTYLRSVLTGYNGSFTLHELRANRTACELAISNGWQALGRMVQEPKSRQSDAVAAERALLFASQLRDETITLGLNLARGQLKTPVPGMPELRDVLDESLSAVCDTLKGNARPMASREQIDEVYDPVAAYLRGLVDRRAEEVAHGAEGTETHRLIVEHAPIRTPLRRAVRLVESADDLAQS